MFLLVQVIAHLFISQKEKEVGTLTLKPALALVSMNMTPCSFALASPSSVDTCLETFRLARAVVFISNLNELTLLLLLSQVQSK
jgi:hypothetical protein